MLSGVFRPVPYSRKRQQQNDDVHDMWKTDVRPTLQLNLLCYDRHFTDLLCYNRHSTDLLWYDRHFVDLLCYNRHFIDLLCYDRHFVDLLCYDLLNSSCLFVELSDWVRRRPASLWSASHTYLLNYHRHCTGPLVTVDTTQPTLRASLSGTLPPNTAVIGYVIEGALISTGLCVDIVSVYKPVTPSASIDSNFIAKCQYNCTMNVLWCQIHSSHIHA